MYTPPVSEFGDWVTRDGLPAFAYRSELAPGADPGPVASERHQLLVGNRSIQICVSADGTMGLWDERYGGRWLTLGDASGTGTSVVAEANVLPEHSGHQNPELPLGLTAPNRRR